MPAELIEIVTFTIGWNQDKGEGTVRLKYSNGQAPNHKIKSLGDLAGWAALLNEKPLYVENGWIHTGVEPIGE